MNNIFVPIICGLISIASVSSADNYSVSKEKCATTAAVVKKENSRKKPVPAKNSWGDAPDFTLQSVEGKNVTLSSFKGKVIILNFWATWCPPCRMELPDFVELFSAYKDKGLIIIGVSLDEGGAATVKKFMKKQPLNYPILIGNQAVTTSYGGLRGIPTTFILDKDGNIKNKIVGARDRAFFENEIKEYIPK